MEMPKSILIKMFICLFALLSIMSKSAMANIWYVNQNNTGKEDGKTWEKAYRSLQSALEVSSPGDQIWVAKGIYKPHESDREISFQLRPYVHVYGGFHGDEKKLEERNYISHETILSGDIGNGNKLKNSITIVRGADYAVLDGFTVSDAYAGADQSQPKLHLTREEILKDTMPNGGGMRNFMVGPIVRNCIFKNNYSMKGAQYTI